jgi:hypothetical protein
VKYSTRNLNEPGIALPLPFSVKLVVEFRPGRNLVDDAPTFYSSDPESDVDYIVRVKGWDRYPGYLPTDVWVDGAF